MGTGLFLVSGVPLLTQCPFSVLAGWCYQTPMSPHSCPEAPEQRQRQMIVPQVSPPPSAHPPPVFRDEDGGLSSPLLPAADDNPTTLLDPEKSPALLEEPLSSEVEEGDEELPAAPLPAGGDGEVAETLPAERPGPPMRLLLPPGPVGAEGLAEAALEDGECWGASKGDTPHPSTGLAP